MRSTMRTLAALAFALPFAAADPVPAAPAKPPPRARPASKAPARKKPPAPPAPDVADPAPTPAAAGPTGAPGATPPAAPSSSGAAAGAPAPASASGAAAAPAPGAEPSGPGGPQGAPGAPAAPAPAPEPPPAPEKKAGPAPAPSAPGAADLARLRAEHQDLKEAIFRSRARRETLEKALLSTQIVPSLEWVGSGRFVVKSAELRLDGVRLWEAGEGQVGDKPVAIAPRSLAPGAHVLGVRVEIRPRDNPKLGYVSEQSFSLDVPEGRKTTIEITIDEDGDPPSYNPEIEIEIDN